MEQNQRILEFPNPQITCMNQPNHYDTMATNYVHSLTSTPYYYSYYAHPQLGFVHERSNLLPPEGYPLNLNPQEMIFHEKKSNDERVVDILEPFRQLYSEREETLKSIFPGLYSKLGELFKKVNKLVSRMDGDGRTLKRSLSMGSSSLKNDWFKVRPIDSEDTVISSN